MQPIQLRDGTVMMSFVLLPGVVVLVAASDVRSMVDAFGRSPCLSVRACKQEAHY
jgi:hypothetical protein